MTCQNNFTLPVELLEQIAVEGFDVLPDLIRIIDNAAVSISSLSICLLDAACVLWMPKHPIFRCRPAAAAPTPPTGQGEGEGFHL